jgi:hypothetical protein
MIIARPVTQTVPMMNGKKPKLPAIGRQDEEKSRSNKGLVEIICSDLKKRVNIMTINRVQEKIVGTKKMLLMIRSLNCRIIGISR